MLSLNKEFDKKDKFVKSKIINYTLSWPTVNIPFENSTSRVKVKLESGNCRISMIIKCGFKGRQIQ